MPAALTEPGSTRTNGTDRAKSELRALALERLVAAVDAFSGSAPEASQRATLRVLRALADAIEVISGSRRPGAERIHAAVENLERSPRNDAATKQALIETSRAIMTVTPSAHVIVEYQRALSALDAAIEAFDVNQSVERRTASMNKVFRAAADALFVMLERRPPYGEARVRAALPRGQKAFADRVETLRSSMDGLARADYTKARGAAGLTLQLFADALDVAPAEVDPQNVDASIAEIRFQSQRLQRADIIMFGQSQWAKRGLTAALDGLAALRGGRIAAAAPWIHTARRAVASIKERSAFTLQRAVVQDAFRTVTDVFVAVALNDAACN